MNRNLMNQCQCINQLLSMTSCNGHGGCHSNNQCNSCTSACRRSNCQCNRCNGGCKQQNNRGCCRNCRKCCNSRDCHVGEHPNLPIDTCLQYPLLPMTTTSCSSTCQNAIDVCQSNDYIYYLMKDCKKVIAVNRTTSEETCYITSRQFSSMTYDRSTHTFLAYAPCSPNVIYRLNCTMEEVDCIELDSCHCKEGAIVSLAYDCCDDTLLVAYKHCIMKVALYKNICQPKSTLVCKSCREIQSIAAISPCITYITKCKDIQVFTLLNEEFEAVIEKRLPSCYYVYALEFDHCNYDSCGLFTIDFYVRKNNCYSHILEALIDGNEVCVVPHICNYYACALPCNDECNNDCGCDTPCNDHCNHTPSQDLIQCNCCKKCKYYNCCGNCKHYR